MRLMYSYSKCSDTTTTKNKTKMDEVLITYYTRLFLPRDLATRGPELSIE